jgi:hypothetical protein
MRDRRASLVINGHESAMTPTSTVIPQSSPVSLILFAIYMSGVLTKCKRKPEPWVSHSSMISHGLQQGKTSQNRPNIRTMRQSLQGVGTSEYGRVRRIENRSHTLRAKEPPSTSSNEDKPWEWNKDSIQQRRNEMEFWYLGGRGFRWSWISLAMDLVGRGSRRPWLCS